MIVTITNQKGGVGKTTTAHTLCSGLAKRGYKVLAVDTDPQSNLTFTAGILPKEVHTDLYTLLKEKAAAWMAVMETAAGFDIIPSSLALAGADMEFTQQGREYMLKEALESIKGNYDFIIIDTPPTLGILTVNALTASDRVIVPMCADIYSIQGLSQLEGTIAAAKKYSNPNLIVDGILLTKYNGQTIIHRQLQEAIHELAEQLKTKVYETPIRNAVALLEVQFLQSDLFTEYPTANVTEDYNAFIEEFLKGMN